MQSLFSPYIIINYYIGFFAIVSYMLVSHFISIVIMYTRKLINTKHLSWLYRINALSNDTGCWTIDKMI